MVMLYETKITESELKQQHFQMKRCLYYSAKVLRMN